MRKETFTKMQRLVGLFLTVLIAVSVMRDTNVLASVGVSLSVVIIILAKKQVKQIQTDERSVLIQQKASTVTLGVFSVASAIAGLLMIEFSYRGYEQLAGYGHFLTYLVRGVVSLNYVLMWHYGRELGN